MKYKQLFNIRLHHAYFLDQGEDSYTSLSPNQQLKALQQYNLSDYLTVKPTSATTLALRNHRILLRTYSEGFRLVVSSVAKEVGGNSKYSPLIPLSDDLILSFGLYSSDPYFENYTEIDRNTNELYLFSNTPNSSALGSANLFIEDGEVDSTFLLSELETRRLVHALASEDDAIKATIDRFSISHIALEDIDGPSQADELNRYIQREKKNGLVGFIRLTIKGDNPHHLLEFDDTDPLDIKQYILTPAPEFEIRFKNRKTFWKYIQNASATILTTENTKPLTKYGVVLIQNSDFNPVPTEEFHFPNPSIYSIRQETGNYYSDIYI